jgi:chorismate-pyruvate lyase
MCGLRSTLIDRGRSAKLGHAAGAFLTVPGDDSPRSRHKRELWQSLNPLQRALMATDGSFTLLLAAVHGETIKTEPLSQSHCATEQTDHQLQLEAGDQLLQREALLKTVPSNRVVTYAESSIVLSRLSLSARQGLQNGSQPIGLVLRQSAIETHRILLDWGDCPDDHLAPSAAIEYLGDIRLLFRTYTIIAHGLPIMLITEYFSHECTYKEK